MENRYSGILPGECYIGIRALADFFCLLLKYPTVMRYQFGIKPKVNTYSYRTPYPPAYDLIPLPNWYKVPDFTKFSGQDDTSTMEHVNRFIIQCGEAANRDELRVPLFLSSLLGSAFT